MNWNIIRLQYEYKLTQHYGGLMIQEVAVNIAVLVGKPDFEGAKTADVWQPCCVPGHVCPHNASPSDRTPIYVIHVGHCLDFGKWIQTTFLPLSPFMGFVSSQNLHCKVKLQLSL